MPARALTALTGVLTLTLAAHATEEHFDVFLTVDTDTNTLTTGRIAFHIPGNPIESPVRIFTEPFGTLAVPTFTDAPGFLAQNGDLPADILVGYDITDTLRVWNNTESHFDDPADEAILIDRFGVATSTPAFPQIFAAGFWLGIANSSGALHDHADFFILPAAGHSDPDPGLYLLTLTLRTDDPSINPSDPIYIVFDYQTDGQHLTEAIAWLEALIEPAPTCPGDINADGYTNLSDFNILGINFGMGPGATRAQGDLNEDGFVNLSDFNVLGIDFGCEP